MKLKNCFGLLSPKKGRNWNHEDSAIDELIFDVLLSFTIALFFGDIGCLVLPRQSEWLGSRFSTQGILFTMFHIFTLWLFNIAMV